MKKLRFYFTKVLVLKSIDFFVKKLRSRVYECFFKKHHFKKDQRYLRKLLRRETVVNKSRENSHSSSENGLWKYLDFILH